MLPPGTNRINLEFWAELEAQQSVANWLYLFHHITCITIYQHIRQMPDQQNKERKQLQESHVRWCVILLQDVVYIRWSNNVYPRFFILNFICNWSSHFYCHDCDHYSQLSTGTKFNSFLLWNLHFTDLRLIASHWVLFQSLHNSVHLSVRHVGWCVLRVTFLKRPHVLPIKIKASATQNFSKMTKWSLSDALVPPLSCPRYLSPTRIPRQYDSYLPLYLLPPYHACLPSAFSTLTFHSRWREELVALDGVGEVALKYCSKISRDFVLLEGKCWEIWSQIFHTWVIIDSKALQCVCVCGGGIQPARYAWLKNANSADK